MTKQKLIVSIVSVLLIIGVAGAIFAFLGNDVFSSGSSGSSGNNSVHLHNFEIETNLPSCSEGGSTRKYCTLCKYEEITEIPPSEHTWLEITGVQETCTEAGYSNYKVCTKCNYTVGRIDYAALGHNLTNVPEVKATCLSSGHSAYEFCSRCDYSTVCTEYSALGHDFEEYDDPVATCTTTGIHHINCTRCDEFDEEIEISYSHKLVPTGRFISLCKEYEGDQCELCGEYFNLIYHGVKHDINYLTGTCRDCNEALQEPRVAINIFNINDLNQYNEFPCINDGNNYILPGMSFGDFINEDSILSNGFTISETYIYYNGFKVYRTSDCDTALTVNDFIEVSTNFYISGERGTNVVELSGVYVFTNLTSDVVVDCYWPVKFIYQENECSCIAVIENKEMYFQYANKDTLTKIYDFDSDQFFANSNYIIFEEGTLVCREFFEWLDIYADYTVVN